MDATPSHMTCEPHELSVGGSPPHGFNNEANFDDLNASFRSLYRSLFDSVGHQSHTPFPLLSSATSHQLAPPDLSLIRSQCLDHYKTSPEPHLTLVMESLRDLADSNQWDQLSPAQIQSLRETVNGGDHVQFGMDHDSFTKWSDSFNQFLSQLNSHIPLPSHSTATSDLRMSINDHVPYSAHNQLVLHPMTSLPPYASSLHHMKSAVVHSHASMMDSGPLHFNHTRPVSQDPPPFSSVATDLFQDTEEEDEFDWSKLV